MLSGDLIREWDARLRQRDARNHYAAKRIRRLGPSLQVFQLPLVPVSGTELVALMPTMEVQYRLIYDIVGAIVFVAVLRLILMLVRDFTRMKTNAWMRDLFLILALGVLVVIVGAPYWVMNIVTPNNYLIAVTVFISFLLIAASFQFGVIRRTIGMTRRRRWVVYVLGCCSARHPHREHRLRRRLLTELEQ